VFFYLQTLNYEMRRGKYFQGAPRGLFAWFRQQAENRPRAERSPAAGQGERRLENTCRADLPFVIHIFLYPNKLKSIKNFSLLKKQFNCLLNT
jgi:hypothetical protein